MRGGRERKRRGTQRCRRDNRRMRGDRREGGKEESSVDREVRKMRN